MLQSPCHEHVASQAHSQRPEPAGSRRKTLRIHMSYRPKYVTFDCYGTLTRFRMGDMARDMFTDRIPA